MSGGGGGSTEFGVPLGISTLGGAGALWKPPGSGAGPSAILLNGGGAGADAPAPGTAFGGESIAGGVAGSLSVEGWDGAVGGKGGAFGAGVEGEVRSSLM